MKNFIQHNFGKITRIDTPECRLYETPFGNRYPSVTSVLSVKPNTHLEEWKAKVGEEEAKRVSARAANRGTAIHSLCEDYLKTGIAKPSVFDQDMFTSLKPELDRINNIHCLETQLFSHKLEVAGTVDVICEYDGELTILDIKTSKRIKTKQEIPNYFIQTSAYAYMFWELTGIAISNLTIMMAVDDNPVQIYKERIKDWLPAFIEIRKEYKILKGF